MWQRYLRTFRIWMSGFFFVLTSLVFLDCFGLLPQRLITDILYPQFLPSLMKSLVTKHILPGGFLVIILLTALTGRVYCSFICPLGCLMDVSSRVSGSKIKHRHSKPHTIIWYTLLVLTIALFVSGSLWLVDLLDPFSIFGRVMGTLARPVIVTANNAVSRLMEITGHYSIPPVDHLKLIPGLYAISLFYLVLVVVMAVKKGRLYCNLICPVGSFLGLFSRISLFRPVLDEQTCNRCGKCERVCKSGCIESKTHTIDLTRCVACFNCIQACPEGSLVMGVSRKKRVKINSTGQTDTTRRNVIGFLILFLTGFPKKLLAQMAKPVVYVRNKIPVKRTFPVTPPGSKSIRHFTSACTACYLCVTRCPGHVIKPGFTVYGKEGVLMPHMANTQGYCNFTCTLCGEICPTGAILPLNLEDKKQTQIGQVIFIRENCIVITQKTECGACSEHCPTKAVNMVVENGLRVPSINPSICVGCGACEYACPSLPHKSIYVDGNAVHQVALKPKEIQSQKKTGDGDFPF